MTIVMVVIVVDWFEEIVLELVLEAVEYARYV